MARQLRLAHLVSTALNGVAQLVLDGLVEVLLNDHWLGGAIAVYSKIGRPWFSLGSSECMLEPAGHQKRWRAESQPDDWDLSRDLGKRWPG